MARVNPQEYAEKWARRTKAAVEDYERGIQRVTVSPGQLAAAQKSLYLSRLQERAGVWAERVAAVDVSAWKRAASGKGKARISSGVDDAQAELAQKASSLLAAVDAAAAQVRAMPKATLEDRINRSVAFQRAMAKYKRG